MTKISWRGRRQDRHSASRPRAADLRTERLEPRIALAASVTATALPVSYGYPLGHTFNELGITNADSSVATSGITTSSTPNFLITIQNPTDGTPEIAGHKFRIEVVRVGDGNTLGEFTGVKGETVGDPKNPLMVPIDTATPLSPGENDLEFRLIDIDTGLSLLIPGPQTTPPSTPPLVVIYDNAPPTLTLNPAPATPAPTVGGSLQVTASDNEDGLASVVLTDQFAGRADVTDALLSSPAVTDVSANYDFPAAEAGAHHVIVTATDRAGRTTTATGDYIDSPAAPAPAAPALEPGSDGGLSHADGLTAATSLTFDASGPIAPGAVVQLLRDGTVVGARTGPGPITDPAPPQGSFQYTLQQLNAISAPGPSSPALTVVVDRTPPAISAQLASASVISGSGPGQATSQSRPQVTVNLVDQAANLPNTLVAGIASIDGSPPGTPTAGSVVLTPPASSGSISLTLPSALSPGQHTVTVVALDAAGNVAAPATLTFTVLPPPAAPDAFETTFDLSGLPGYNPSKPAYPWTMSFDRTTQTIWADIRGGDPQAGTEKIGGGEQVVQLDPATGTARVFDMKLVEPNISPAIEPHGIFFDFETHLTPRVYFTQREAGLLSFIDPTTDQLVDYDLGTILRAQGYSAADIHAVDVDAAGNVWMSDMDDMLLLEFDTHRLPDGTPQPPNSVAGSLIIHPLPMTFIHPPGPTALAGKDLVGPHGIDFVTDERTGQDYIWFSDLGANAMTLLRPGAGPGGTDLWTSWDMSNAPGIHPDGGAPLFTAIDTAETPGVPQDDRVVMADPGSQVQFNNVIRELTPEYLPDGTATDGQLQTWTIPPQPGSASSGGGGGGAAGSGGEGGGATPLAQPNQAYVDRDGNIYFIDRKAGVGMFNPQTFSIPTLGEGVTVTAKASTDREPADAPLALVPTSTINFGTVPTVTLKTSTKTVANDSPVPGLAEYPLVGANAAGGRGAGPFRGTLSAANVLYGSLTQNDQLTATVFAETTRRPLSVVEGPGGARQAFQVLRDGHLVETGHGPGQLIDAQLDVTQAIGGPAFASDPSATTDAQGVVYVFGRDPQGGLLEYRYDPASNAWSARSLGLPPATAGVLAADPVAFVDPSRGAGAFETTDRGHLVLYWADGTSPVDLSAQPAWGGAGPVYSSAATVQFGGTQYVYATNQRGQLVQVTLGPGGSLVSANAITLPGGRDTEVFQDVEAVVVGSERHIFATDGNSRLVHVVIGPDAGPTGLRAENVTLLTQASAAGYSAYQQPFAARVYPDLAVTVDPTNQDLYVYGTNGRDLVEFHQSGGVNGTWQATDLTNSLPGPIVFGAPDAYILPNGERHVLQINADAEVIEYYKLNGFGFSTQNITLASGNSASPAAFPPAAGAASGQHAGAAAAVRRMLRRHPLHLTHHQALPHPTHPRPSHARPAQSHPLGPHHSRAVRHAGGVKPKTLG